MQRALDLAYRAWGQTSPNPAVGAVVVRQGSVVGEGFHEKAGKPHAEVVALGHAKSAAAGSTLYVTLEPCCHVGRTPPCTDAISRAGVTRVVVGMRDPNPLVSGKGIRALRKAGIRVSCGILRRQAIRLNEAYVHFHSTGLPFVIVKWAMTLDGRTSTDKGESRWISNELSRRYVHQLRSGVDAILVGAGTVARDNPRLSVRLKGRRVRQPLRVILDDTLRIPITARCLDTRQGARVVLFTTQRASSRKIRALERRGHRVMVMHARRGRFPVRPLLRTLAQLGIQSLLIEGGREVCGTFFSSHAVQKVIVFIAPKIVGGRKTTSPIINWAIPRIRNALQLREIEIKTFHDDVCVEGYV
jgi:diaminohydroxyphosphoribosylaminopyrimidine deaminase/5-amino-6-(5-phosphoribosylamino)uracil reductase